VVLAGCGPGRRAGPELELLAAGSISFHGKGQVPMKVDDSVTDDLHPYDGAQRPIAPPAMRRRPQLTAVATTATWWTE